MNTLLLQYTHCYWNKHLAVTCFNLATEPVMSHPLYAQITAAIVDLGGDWWMPLLRYVMKMNIRHNAAD